MSNIQKFQEGNNKTLDDIKQLQSQEMDIYNYVNNQKLSSEEKKQSIDQMNKLSQMRVNLYSSLNNMYSSYTQNVESSNNTLDEQLLAINIVEKELNEAKIRLKALEQDKTNKLRMVEINTYYSKQYAAYTDFMKTVVFLCIPMLILAILGNKGLIPQTLNIILIGIIMVLFVLIIGYKLIDIITRNNMNFDEYNWYFQSDYAPPASTEDPVDPWADKIQEKICTPEDEDINSGPESITTETNTTESTTTESTTTESFINIGDVNVGEILGKYSRTVFRPVASFNNLF